MGVADDELNAAQAAVLELAQELGPEGFGLAVPDLAAQDFPSAVGTHPSGDTTACDTIRWLSRTLQ